MPNITSSFSCGYEIVSYTQNIEFIEKQDEQLLARRVNALVRRKFSSNVTHLSHMAGNILSATDLCANNGSGQTLCGGPSTAKFYCSSDVWEHDEYGPTGYAFETWLSYSPFQEIELPTEPTGSLAPITATCSAPTFGIRSSIQDIELRMKEIEGKEELDGRRRHNFTLTREFGGVTNFQPSAGAFIPGSGINASFGAQPDLTLSPNAESLYMIESDSLRKIPNQPRFIRTVVFTGFSEFMPIDLEELNLNGFGE